MINYKPLGFSLYGARGLEPAAASPAGARRRKIAWKDRNCLAAVNCGKLDPPLLGLAMGAGRPRSQQVAGIIVDCF